MKKIVCFLLFFTPFLLHAQISTPDPAIQAFALRIDAELGQVKKNDAANDKKAMARNLASLAEIYLRIAKHAPDSSNSSQLIPQGRKANLSRSIEYATRAAALCDSIGDEVELKRSYKTLYAAQKQSGNIKGAVETYGRIVALNRPILQPKKKMEIEKRQLEYKFGKREDSLIQQKHVVEAHLENQTRKLSSKQKELDSTSINLYLTRQEKELQQSKLELQQSRLELQQSKLRLQQEEISKKDRDIASSRREREVYIMGLIGLLIISMLAYRTIRLQRRYTKALIAEKKRSEDLLLNILPAEVAEELKEKGYADARQFDSVTVLFTDFVSFTSLAETMSPQQLVSELHVCFKAFDDILDKHRIEKIKTIGDAYMAVCGLPVANPHHARHIVAAAVEIRDFMQQRKAALGTTSFSVRIGINSGNVVAGIVGSRKFSYDIWGDTVNTAARMEQHSEEGMINISQSTYDLIKDKYECIYRGKVDAKNKGSIDMYYLVA